MKMLNYATVDNRIQQKCSVACLCQIDHWLDPSCCHHLQYLQLTSCDPWPVQTDTTYWLVAEFWKKQKKKSNIYVNIYTNTIHKSIVSNFIISNLTFPTINCEMCSAALKNDYINHFSRGCFLCLRHLYDFFFFIQYIFIRMNSLCT